MLATDDGGKTWTKASRMGTWPVAVFDDGKGGGWIVANKESGNGCNPLSEQPDEQILETNDGGKAWQARPLSGPAAQYLQDSPPVSTQMGFADDNNGWILSPHSVFYTPDAGRTWGDTP